ncbi:sulfurtransferase [Peribacillus alkalitolerans]|uniref:sulfurtransferase n=1 Tax=Peribacillus alkalitolerans TaxID=1550385 RepID=UPI0013D80B47|nr:sulfurtransferase [Peribacillus alkalitolerans]
MFVDKEWVMNQLTNDDVILIDCHFQLGNPTFGKEHFGKEHIPGAIFFDLEEDLSGTVQSHGGRHPLPDLKVFQEKLEQRGISPKNTVVAYDDGAGPYASRLYWMMKYVGHEKVYILNGGLTDWKKADLPIEIDCKQRKSSNYPLKVNPEILATYEEVQKVSQGHSLDVTLIDSREGMRYKGIEEPIDRIAGHIPGSINEFWMNGLSEGRFLLSDEQKNRFKHLDADKEIIVYCGSGVTASPNFVALKEAGFNKVKVYIGSYSDWVSYPENPVSKEL